MLACLIIIAVLFVWAILVLVTIEDELDDVLTLLEKKDEQQQRQKYLDFIR